MCENILFGHALLGCDTTSRVHGNGKGAVLKQLRNSEDFSIQAEVLITDWLWLKRSLQLEKKHWCIFTEEAKEETP